MQSWLVAAHAAAAAALLVPAAQVPPSLPSQAACVRPAPPTSTLLAFIQPEGLGAAKANKANPSAGGNAEGNWWTPSKIDPQDQMGKVAEIRARQALVEENARYKVDKLERLEREQAARAARQAAQQAELQAKQAKYANRR
jgi:hypothetical protein